MIELNNGISLRVNFGKLTDFNARKHNYASVPSFSILFKFPAATKIDFKALIPKS